MNVDLNKLDVKSLNLRYIQGVLSVPEAVAIAKIRNGKIQLFGTLKGYTERIIASLSVNSKDDFRLEVVNPIHLNKYSHRSFYSLIIYNRAVGSQKFL